MSENTLEAVRRLAETRLRLAAMRKEHPTSPYTGLALQPGSRWQHENGPFLPLPTSSGAALFAWLEAHCEQELARLGVQIDQQGTDSEGTIYVAPPAA